MPAAPHLLIIGMGPRLGLAAARRFGRGGYRIGMIARSSSHLAVHHESLGDAGIDSQFAAADVTDADALRDAIAKLVVTGGTPSVVLFNAVDRVVGRALTIAPDAVTRAMSVSVLGSLTALQALLPGMCERGTGALLFTGSARALDPRPHEVADAAAKAALRALVLAAARDHERDGLHLAMLTLNSEPRVGTAFDPDRVAEALWSLAQEPSGAWTRERVFSGQLI
ncbi:MAG: short-chain dehydrogenase/reductase [Pseudonocardiales bacterium]|nr:short-chain dehydrogenase/reductase [Jatrophihabitantaceae bacterium]MCW2603539.1 short-chain dehydrogenase/reductase [Pseudonocardiales bacterium]